MSATPLAIQSLHNQNRFSTPTSPLVSDSGKSQQGTPYLPGFLLGNVNTSNNTPAYGRTLSTAHQNQSPALAVGSKSPPNVPFPERKQPRLSPSNTSNQEGAPPIESLYSTNYAASSGDVSTANKSLLTNDATLNRSCLDNSIFSPRQEAIPQSPAQIDPFYTQGEDITSDNVLDDTSVTVFGFPPAASSFILQQFSLYGTIEKHEIHSVGNWLHIKYQTKIQAKKALSKNGKIFANSIMIGVLPCIKKELVALEASVNITNMTSQQVDDVRKTPTMRSLSNSNSLMKNNLASETITNNQLTPQKKNSVVGKALDYVFGW